jgi:hypothetical protein
MDTTGVWYCTAEHLLLIRLGVPPQTPAGAGAAPAAATPPPPRAAVPQQPSRYADLRASLAQQAICERHAAVLRAAARRVRLLRGHLEAGLDLLAGDRREERVVRSVLVHPEVRDALAELLLSLGGPPPPAERPETEPHSASEQALRALDLVRGLEEALVAAGGGRRDAQAPARRAAVELLGYVDSEVRRGPEAA